LRQQSVRGRDSFSLGEGGIGLYRATGPKLDRDVPIKWAKRKLANFQSLDLRASIVSRWSAIRTRCAAPMITSEWRVI